MSNYPDINGEFPFAGARLSVRADTLFFDEPHDEVIAESSRPARQRLIIEGEAAFMERVGKLLGPLVVQIKGEIEDAEKRDRIERGVR